eukprot:2355993-Rhodomonas_salina.1
MQIRGRVQGSRFRTQDSRLRGSRFTAHGSRLTAHGSEGRRTRTEELVGGERGEAEGRIEGALLVLEPLRDQLVGVFHRVALRRCDLVQERRAFGDRVPANDARSESSQQ